MKNTPPGRLRTNTTNGRTKYYILGTGGGRNGKYISKENKPLARALAQKRYDEKVYRAALQEEKAIERFLAAMPQKQSEAIYVGLSKSMRELIMPIKESEEELTKRWLSKEYHGKEFREGAPVYYTDNEERVRSKSEVIIANALKQSGVPYRYEYPIELKGIGRIHPDFMILKAREKREIIWEHFGMMSDPNYVESAVRKLSAYQMSGLRLGIDLIVSFETAEQPLDTRLVKKMIGLYLK